MQFSKLWVSLSVPAVGLLMVSCTARLSLEKVAQVSSFRVAPVSSRKMVVALPSAGGERVSVPAGSSATEGAVMGALGQVAIELDAAQFRKKYAASVDQIGRSLPTDVGARVDRKVQSRVVSTGRVVKSGGGLLRIEIEKSGVMQLPARFIRIGEMKVIPFVLAKVSLESATGEVVTTDRIVGFAESPGYQSITGAMSREFFHAAGRDPLKDGMWGTKRSRVPDLNPNGGKTPAAYAANPALLRSDYDAAVNALAEDLIVFLNEVYGKKS